MTRHESHDDSDFEGASAEGPSAPKPLQPLELELDADRELDRLRGLGGPFSTQPRT